MTYHGDIKDRIRQQGLLHGVMLELTYKCNLDCFFCYNDRGLEGKQMMLSDYQRLLDDLANMGVLFVTLTGGEPLVHPDFFAIGGAARERGFVTYIKTGGHGLKGAVARRLKQEVDPLGIEISLHGATAETHDRQTQVPGSFDKLIRALPELIDLGLRPLFVSTLTAWNEHQIDEMFELVNSFGLRLRFQGPVAPRDDGDTEPLSIQPSEAAWQHMAAVAEEWRQTALADTECAPREEKKASSEPKAFCGAGSEGILIDPYGSVVSCLQLRRSAGNVHQQPIHEIWRSHVFRDARQLSYDSATRIKEEGPLSILGAPLYCPGLEEKGCSCSSQSEGAGRGCGPGKEQSGLVSIGSLA